ncbi:alpha/beta fold hydrolase [Bacillus sp. JJ722]|uniref:alpha/beta fold hydrolase n=1 Tax=Bacillus sp. JJ722 TaxID=3122973 RepID=UPI002FFDB136
MARCEVSKGSINYEIIGNGFPIVIMHLLGTDYRSMKSWLEPIFNDVQGFQRIYIDLPAHGHSEINDNVNSTEDMLLNILDFIDSIIPNQIFSLIGFSFGGYLAQGVLHSRREQVKSICLLAPALHVKERKLPDKVIFSKDDCVINRLDSDTRIAFETLMNHQTSDCLTLFLEEIQPGRLLANKKFLMSDWKEKRYLLSIEPFSDVRFLPQSALFILGKQDAICGYKDHLNLLEKFPNSSYVVLNQAGHMLHIEKREVVQGLISDWLINELNSKR